ncbi:boophilin-H2 [Esox lucius]|uniref:BPTI/Kunitz inhibitor domain-containing protein n=1 Tax=Esox lucius TaxID=8010 RepID=A0A3P9A800_ESOLU|nr:boophilin-H2 [Esox lucius]
MANSLLNIFVLGVLLPIVMSKQPFCNSEMDEGTAVQGTEGHNRLQYYYNKGQDICMPFFYKGLGGNENRFNTDRECMGNCSAKFEELYPTEDGVCKLPLDHGNCFAMLLMYYYNADEKNCRIFHYGGCQGNGNRFETREQCQKTCMAKSGRLIGGVDPEPNPDASSTNIGLIIGVLGGVLFTVAVISAVVLIVVQRKEKSSKKGRKKVPTIEMS